MLILMKEENSELIKIKATQGQKPAINFKPTCDAKPDLHLWDAVKYFKLSSGRWGRRGEVGVLHLKCCKI